MNLGPEVDENDGLAPDIGERIRAYRESLSLSQEKFASAFGGTKRAIQNNESGKTAPNSKLLRELARRGLNVNWLLTGNGPMLFRDLTPKNEQIIQIDHDLVIYVIEALDAELKKRKRQLPIRKYAELVALFYELCQQTGQRDASIMGRLLKIA
jgi:transcriptional regulator with XRE-family HTH domain